MKVTDKQYHLDGFLISLLDHCAKREKNKFDNLLILDGMTGSGKTTLGFQLAYYYSYIMKKSFGVDNVFFDAEQMIEYAQNNKNKIIVWDESAFDGMSVDWQNQNQKNLIKLLYTARKLGHFLIFIIPEFRKLQSVFALDKSFVLIRVYVKEGLKRGYWKAYNQNRKRWLYYSELKYNSGNKVFPNTYGKFINVENLIDMDAYEAKKDKAIMSIGDTNKQAEFKVSNIPKEIIKRLKDEGFTDAKIGKIFGVSQQHVTRLKNYMEK